MDGDLYKSLTPFDASIMQWPKFRFKFETFLESKELLHIVKYLVDDHTTQGITEADAKKRKDSRRVDDARVRSFLINKVSDDVLNIIQTCSTAYDMFDTLTQQYQ